MKSFGGFSFCYGKVDIVLVMSLLHTCYELAKNLLRFTSKQVHFFCAKEYRISDASYSYDREKTCKDSTILVGLFCCPKSWKNVASEPLKPQNFVAAFPNMRCISQKRNALLRICGETIGTGE